jgi:hypothetical protein
MTRGSRGPMRLRPYQTDVVARAATHFDGHDRGQLISGCGSGKTPTSLSIADELRARRVGITVPSLQLVSQWARVIRRQYGNSVRILAVCSDPGADQLKAHQVALTTDPLVVRRAMLDAMEPGAPRLFVVATYHSSPVLSAALTTNRHGVFDLLIADEAHRTAGEGADHAFRTVVLPNDDPGAIRARRRLFVTATPRDCPNAEHAAHRPLVVRLIDEDAARLGVASLTVIPALEGREDPSRYRVAPIADGEYLSDGSLLAVRPLVPHPFIDPEPGWPVELVRFVLDQTTGHIDLAAPRVDGTLVVPTAADLPAARAAVRDAIERHVLAPGMPLLDAVHYFARRSTMPFYMDDRALYGEIIADVPDAMVEAAGFTAPYRIVLCGVRASAVDAAIRSLETLPAIPTEDLQQLVATHLALQATAERFGVRRGMVYHSAISDANTFASLAHWIPGSATDLRVDPVHTGVAPVRRGSTLAAFGAPLGARDSDTHILSAVRMGLEGQDIAATDLLAFTSPKERAIDVIQAKGRAVRRDPARPEKVATVLVPIVIDDTTPLDRTTAVGRVSARSRAVAESVLAALHGSDERALQRLVSEVSDVNEAVRVATRASSAIPLPLPEVERALRALDTDLRHQLAGVSPRRYTGVAFDPAADAFRAHLAVQFPNADPTRAIAPVVSSLHRTAREAAAAVDRHLDELGLTPTMARNFGRAFALQRRAGEPDPPYRGIAPVPDGGWVAIYSVRRTKHVALRYAATREEAALVRDALQARYGDRGVRNFPDLPVRHDLTARAGSDGVEYDMAARRWWAMVHVPHLSHGDVPCTAGLGFFASEHDARHALFVARAAATALGATATSADVERTVATALSRADIRTMDLETRPLVASEVPRVVAAPAGSPVITAVPRVAVALSAR